MIETDIITYNNANTRSFLLDLNIFHEQCIERLSLELLLIYFQR